MMKKDSKGYGVASLILSIMGILAMFTPYFGIVFSILAIVFGRKQQKIKHSGIATVGFIIGIVGVCINGILFLVLGVALMVLGPSIW